MTPRGPDEIDRKLRRWLWQEEQRWKRARHADVAALVVKSRYERARITPEERNAGRVLAEAANAGAASVLITPKSARKGREMLAMDWPDVAKLAGLIPSVALAFETSGRSTTLERRRLQSFFEGEGLVFSRDGGVSWAE